MSMTINERMHWHIKVILNPLTPTVAVWIQL